MARQMEQSRRGSRVALFVILAAFWFLLSGRVGLQYAIFMLAAVGVVMWINPERPFASEGAARGEGLRGVLRSAVLLVRYLVWLIWNVFWANLQVARIILDPRLPIDPRLIVFRTRLGSPVARTLVANTITLTPGTVTVELDEDEYLVHSLAPRSAEAVRSAALQNVIAALFGEPPEPPPEIREATSYRELQG